MELQESSSFATEIAPVYKIEIANSKKPKKTAQITTVPR